jgi:hypothetical protein
LDGDAPFVRVPASISKNGKSATLGLRPELIAALRLYRPDLAQPFEWAFRGRVPNIDTFYRDVSRAKISKLDEFGRRVDFHALRTTFGTHLQVAGVPMRAAMEMMRHSDPKLTMKVYTDAAHLPLTTELARLPSFGIQCAQNNAQKAVVAGLAESQPVAIGHLLASAQTADTVAFSRSESVPDLSGHPANLVDSISVTFSERAGAVLLCCC